MKSLPDNSVDCCVTDPPYGWKFMGKKWDYEIPREEVWEEVLRVLKPGAHILVACGTRTQHRMAVNIEDAGFEIRDVISWIYGSGFPKSVNLGKQIDKEAGAEREVTQSGIVKGKEYSGKFDQGSSDKRERRDAPSTDAAKQWDGWETALKPAQELWTLARKPLAEKTIAANVLEYGTGGLNIDGCRIGRNENDRFKYGRSTDLDYPKKSPALGRFKNNSAYEPDSLGRFPSNVIFDETAAALLDEQTGVLKSGARKGSSSADENRIFKLHGGQSNASKGGASRFFYCAKADPAERNNGLYGFSKEVEHSYADECATCGGRIHQNNDRPSACKCENSVRKGKTVTGNYHPTVKPLALMQYLIRLVCPPNGIVVEPFAGSGTTCIAARKEDKNFIGFELNPEYIEIANRRLKAELGMFI